MKIHPELDLKTLWCIEVCKFALGNLDDVKAIQLAHDRRWCGRGITSHLKTGDCCTIKKKEELSLFLTNFWNWMGPWHHEIILLSFALETFFRQSRLSTLWRRRPHIKEPPKRGGKISFLDSINGWFNVYFCTFCLKMLATKRAFEFRKISLLCGIKRHLVELSAFAKGSLLHLIIKRK